MRRTVAASLVSLVVAIVMAACGGTPITPTPGGGGNGGGGITLNTPPQVKSITASDTRIEVGTPITLTAVVEDAETPIANLSVAWVLPPGSVTGTGNGTAITFTPSADLQTPADYEITVNVTERYTSNGVQAENRAAASVTLRFNNSPRELADMSVRFLNDFANSNVSPDKCLGEFDDTQSTCARGKSDEFNDIFMNRHDLLIMASTIRPTSVSIAPSRTSATVHTFCSFTSKVISDKPLNCPGCVLGSVGTTTGDCFTTNVYVKGRWWLCESHYNSTSNSLTALQRALEQALFGIRRPEIP